MAAEIQASDKVVVQSFDRRKPARRPLPEHLPRERVVYPFPSACPCCGGELHKLGEDVSETLEPVPRQWKVVCYVREKYSCRSCEAITQPPAPSHPIARGRAGPGLLAHVLFSKYGLHLPLHRQSRTYAREGIELDVSTLADWVGASAATLMPLVEVLRAHVFAAKRLHADDTPVPVLDTGRTRTGRLWTYVRDDRPFAGHAPPAAIYFYSPDRSGAHPEAHLGSWAGRSTQADAYAGFNRLYELTRQPGPIVEAACWAHARRKFFDLARLTKAPIALEAVARIDALVRHRARPQRPVARRTQARPPRAQPPAGRSPGQLAARATRQALRQQPGRQGHRLQPQAAGPPCIRFLDDGRLCLSNNAAERALRGIAVGRHNWTFAGSDEGGQRAAAIYTLIETAKLNDVDPRGLARPRPWHTCRTTQPSASTSCCPGTGRRYSCKRPPLNQQQPPRPSPDAYVDKGSELACQALERIGLLFDIETAIRGHQPAERQAVRQAHAGPVLEALRQWLNTTLRRVPGRSDLAAAIRYARPRWEQLCRYR